MPVTYGSVDNMGLTHLKGNYCIKCQNLREEAIGITPRCEKCGTDLKYVELPYTPARYAGYVFLGLLALSIIGLVIMTLVWSIVGIIALVMVCIMTGILAVVCMVVNNTMMQKKITAESAGAQRPIY